jgi:hypothetical protein
MNKHREFMSHRPPVFTHAANPLDADDWLKTVGKMLTTAQCDDREKVLFAAGRLQGPAGAWWDAYTTSHATTNAITWPEFTESFRNHNIPAGVMRLKKKEFLCLKQGRMSVAEYQDTSIELSRYAPEQVVDDPKKQELFMEGLAGPLRYQLMSHTFPTFQQLLDKAIVLESMRRELGELKRKASTPGQSGSSTRPRFTSPPGVPFRPGDPTGGYGQQPYQYQPQQYQQFQRTPQQFPRPGSQTPRPTYPQHRPMTPVGTPVRPGAPHTPAGNTCFKCGEARHYANACPKRHPLGIPVQMQQMRSGNQTP